MVYEYFLYYIATSLKSTYNEKSVKNRSKDLKYSYLCAIIIKKFFKI